MKKVKTSEIPPTLRQNREAFSLAMMCLAAAILLGGCAFTKSSPRYQGTIHQLEHAVAAYPPSEADARNLHMFAADGSLMGWPDLMQAVAWADIIILGEQHDDPIAHAVQLAVTEDTFSNWPNSAISLEMLERDEQPLVDDYFEGIIDAPTLAKLTHSENWAGEGTWVKWYQPLIDVAKNARGGRGAAVAANAPRRYVRLARLEGYDRLKQLPKSRRSLFDLPRKELDSGYRERFFDLMRDTPSHGEESDKEVDEEEARQKQAASFRSQSLWDATMAASIVKAKKKGAAKVIHCVGQFHSDFRGGLVQQIQRRLPRGRIVVITMQRVDGPEFRDEDRNRGDIIIYTGQRPPEESKEDEPDSPAETDGSDATETPAETTPRLDANPDPVIPENSPPTKLGFSHQGYKR